MKQEATYLLPENASVVLEKQRYLIDSRSGRGSVLVSSADRTRTFLPGKQLDELLRDGACVLENEHGEVVVAGIEDDSFRYLNQLSGEERKNVRFRAALCYAIHELVGQGLRLSEGILNKPQVRQDICKLAAMHFEGKIAISALRGGSMTRVFPLPKGRTLLKYYRLFEAEHFDPLALQGKHRWKGNRTSRLAPELRPLMTEASKAWLDKRKPPMAKAYQKLKLLLKAENVSRRGRGEAELALPSQASLRAHIDKHVSSIGQQIAREGERAAYNKRGPGSTDLRALMFGELVEIDECKLSILIPIKRAQQPEEGHSSHGAAPKGAEEVVTKRVHLLLMIDVATRMPLAWTLAEQPSADATLELLRMATRSKEREKVKHGCDQNPAPAVGIGKVRNDNGTGLRNREVKEAMAGLGIISVDTRSYHSSDRPFIERLFGTIESELISGLTGYTGNAAGALPGYDAVENAKLPLDALYQILTRYLVDVYSHTAHHGFGMDGRTPYQAMQRVLKEAGMVRPPSMQSRRIHLGGEVNATPTDEGIKACGLPYQSREFQRLRDLYPGKWTVCIDPDRIQAVTVQIEGYVGVIEAELTATYVASLTLAEFVEAMEERRRQAPHDAEVSEYQFVEALRAIEKINATFEPKPTKGSSFSTFEELEERAQRVTSGIHLAPSTKLLDVVEPGGLMADDPVGALPIGRGLQAALELEEPLEDDTQTALAPASRLGRPDTKGLLK
ncbi:DDE-type integrase/transposase/recombinase [Limimaricola hongkongensis]|uniref:Integrase catalytic domain-containing protein n=1 Tax=Limimaricola hongkongensis DSM 17492 TaxID=1122180 RepID=A0A017HAC5_9RHOB|nr:DDE-type integrase/transposase/recombinase [Limimaricola hongkongensis]EYD70739.1 hypothetical protein Lokhon_02380 [Limimaricola hongkongensis DSM 17492]